MMGIKDAMKYNFDTCTRRNSLFCVIYEYIVCVKHRVQTPSNQAKYLTKYYLIPKYANKSEVFIT